MGNDEIKYHFEAIHSAADTMGQQQGQLSAQNDQLETYVKNLVAQWTGDAQTAYQGKQQDWTTAFAGLQQALTGIVSATHDAATGMHGTDTQNKATWS
jgi:WXG100 family type VII secretion target